MKNPSGIVLVALSAALICPVAVQAAKAERRDKKKQASEQLPVAFAAADADGNGSVSKEEFISALKEKLGEGGAASKFVALDKGADGKLSKEEYSGGTTERKRRKKDK